MADKKSSKEAKRFVSLLASRFKQDKYDIERQELLSYFTDAVSNLPKGKVKSALQKEFDAHFKQLSSILDPVPKKSKRCTDLSQKTYFKINLYAKEGLEKALNAYKDCKSNEEKKEIYKSLRACYPFLKDSKKIFTMLKEDNTSDDLSVVQKCTQMTIGCHTKKSVLECLTFILGEFSSKCEACIQETKSDSKTESAMVLQEALNRNIVLMNHRWKASKSTDNGNDFTPEDSYEDLMAAMLSLYTDMLLVSRCFIERNTLTTENLATLIFAILGHSPEHCMDVFLQVTQLDDTNEAALIPLLRSILERNQGTQNTTQYIKFICFARMCSSIFSSANVKTSIHKVAESQAAPTRFVSVLSRCNKSLVDNLKLTKKMTSNNVTTCLLGEQREEDIEALLDMVTEFRQDEDQEPQGDHGPTDEPQGDQSEDQPLFFIDSSGGKEDVEEIQRVEYEELKVEDAILHRQLKSIIGQLQQDSDSEEDLVFEKVDDVEKLFVIDKTSSKQLNQDIQKDVVETTKKDELDEQMHLEQTEKEEVISNDDRKCTDSLTGVSTPRLRKRKRRMDAKEKEREREDEKFVNQTSSESDSKKRNKENKEGSDTIKRMTPAKMTTRSSARKGRKT